MGKRCVLAHVACPNDPKLVFAKHVVLCILAAARARCICFFLRIYPRQILSSCGSTTVQGDGKRSKRQSPPPPPLSVVPSLESLRPLPCQPELSELSLLFSSSAVSDNCKYSCTMAFSAVYTLVCALVTLLGGLRTCNGLTLLQGLVPLCADWLVPPPFPSVYTKRRVDPKLQEAFFRL